jgi:hypothetical protein
MALPQMKGPTCPHVTIFIHVYISFNDDVSSSEFTAQIDLMFNELFFIEILGNPELYYN